MTTRDKGGTMAEKAGLYRVTFDVGNEGEPGAPILHVQALVYAPTGRITGTANITQAVEPPGDNIEIHDLRGEIRWLGEGPAKRLVALSGFISPDPPSELLEGFSASLEIEQGEWRGEGSFKYGAREVKDVPVTSKPCE